MIIKNMKKLFYFKLFGFLFISHSVYAQNIDSLKLALKNAKNDTTKINLYIAISEWCDLNEIIDYANPAVELCEKNLKKFTTKTKLTKGELYLKHFYMINLAASYNNLAYFYGNYDGEKIKNLVYFKKSISILENLLKDNPTGNEAININQGLSSGLSNMGVLYDQLGDTPNALENYFKSLKIREKIKDKEGIAITQSNIGVVYYKLKDYKTALLFYFKALKLQEEISDKIGIAQSLNNIGALYENQIDPSCHQSSEECFLKGKLNALDYYRKSLKINEEITEKSGIAQVLGNIGFLYYNLFKFNKKTNNKIACDTLYHNAIMYYDKSIAIYEKLHEIRNLSFTINNKATLLFHNNEVIPSKILAEKCLEMSKKMGKPENIQRVSLLLSNIYSKMGNYKSAYEMEILYHNMSDSISSENNRKSSIQKSFQYEYDKKVIADSIRNFKEKEVSQAKLSASEASLKQEKTQRFALYGGLLLVLVFAGFMFNRFKVTQKQKQTIELKEKETQSQNLIISQQKHIVEEKHKEITDSINYAERIQRSLLASKELLNNNLKEHFVYFQPKDVVSGDFYWAANLSNETFALVTADSTGHGVPGAIMSILNISCLKETIKEGILEPSSILNNTRKLIIETLKKDGSAEGGKDGMDCSLISFNFKNQQMTYAAANNPIWIVREKQLLDFPPDKMPIGKHDRDSVSFTQHTIDLQKNDVVYSLTDGMPDQFGGPKGKKFMYKQLKELLISIAHLPMQEQKEKLSTALNNWKGDLEQIDDITLIGVRI